LARPKSEDRKKAILAATVEIIAAQGLGAPTLEIAKRAKVPHGSVFTYFDTKTDLFNALYRELKTELVATVMASMPVRGRVRVQLYHLWVTWTHWGATHPAKRRALAHLSVSDQVTDASRRAAYEAAEFPMALIRRASAKGALCDAPLQFVGALFEVAAATTMDFMTRNSARADELCESGFEAVWRALT
jgi:AcrR family transcriptional regulator